jgi:hypothetical protein
VSSDLRVNGLSQLRLSNTKVTDAGIKELERAVPSLTIYSDSTPSN